MDCQDSSAYSTLLERRLETMRCLAAALENSKTALLGADPEAVVELSSMQLELCRCWSELEQMVRKERRVLPEQNRPTIAQTAPRPTFWAEMAEVEARVQHLQRVHAALLRRMRRTIAILSHLLSSNRPTYVGTPGTSNPDRVRNL